MRGLKLCLLLLVAAIATISAHADLGATLGSARDNQTIEVSGYEYLKSLDLSKNVTLVGVGDNATVDGCRLRNIPQIGAPGRHTTVVLENLVIRNFTRIYDDTNLIIKNCRFIGSEIRALNCSILAKNSSFSRSVNGSNIGHGGGLCLYNVDGIFDKCRFYMNSAFRNGTWNGGSGGGLMIDDNSTVTLIDPLISGNIAAFGGGICVVNSTLTIYGGRIIHNRAVPVNYTNPVSYFGGEGGAISAVHSKVLLAHTFIADNPSRRIYPPITAKDSDIRSIDSRIFP